MQGISSMVKCAGGSSPRTPERWGSLPVMRRACAGPGAPGDSVRTSTDVINIATHLERQATV
jgi:hypothetical protein